MTVPQPREIPEFPTLTAELFDGGSGRLDLPDGERELAGEHLRACAQQALDLAARYADQTLRRPVRLRASDPGGISLFGVYPDGTCVELEARQPRSPSPAEPTAPPAAPTATAQPPARGLAPSCARSSAGRNPSNRLNLPRSAPRSTSTSCSPLSRSTPARPARCWAACWPASERRPRTAKSSPTARWPTPTSGAYATA